MYCHLQFKTNSAKMCIPPLFFINPKIFRENNLKIRFLSKLAQFCFKCINIIATDAEFQWGTRAPVVWAIQALWNDILKNRFHDLDVALFSATRREAWWGKRPETHHCVQWTDDKAHNASLRIYGIIADFQISYRQNRNISVNTW